MAKSTHYIDCPEYTLDDHMELGNVSTCIDAAIREHYLGNEIIVRAVQSGKHEKSRQELIEYILRHGDDRHQKASESAANASDDAIDLHGYQCTVNQEPISHFILQGFHIFKPKALERPQHRADLWLIYDSGQLQNVPYMHTRHNVIAKDGFRYKHPDKKPSALLGMIVIN